MNKHGNQTHGHTAGYSRTKEWRAWNAMIRRCKYNSMDRFDRYGGRGITVCDRWLDFGNFLHDVGRAPSKDHSLGRIDNDRCYEPGNVRWETNFEQHRNTSRNRYIEYNGERMIVSDWAKKLGLKRTTLEERLKRGWSVEKAFTTKVK